MAAHRGTGEPTRVVLADDHLLVRQGTRRILEESGRVTVVAEAADGHEAIAAVEAAEPDVAIIDIGMPGLNGIEATRRIKETYPAVGVLVLTVHDDDQYVFALLDAGAAGYLLKDVAGEQLVEAVEAVHGGEAVLHPAITQKVLARVVERGSGGTHQPSEDRLTEREHEALRLAASGMPNKEIASTLGVSVRTVETHLSRVFAKLRVGSRTEAVLYGLRRGWFGLDDLGPPP